MEELTEAGREGGEEERDRETRVDGGVDGGRERKGRGGEGQRDAGRWRS